MVRIELVKADGLFCGFSAKGHAGCGDPGEDIVCAAISAIMQTAVGGITETANIPAGVSLREGDLLCTVDRDADRRQSEDADLLIRTMQQGLSAIQQQYPKALKIMVREV